MSRRAPAYEVVIKPINWQREGRRQESFHNTHKAREKWSPRPALLPVGKIGKVGFLLLSFS